jgi:hypothetical protein
MYVNPESQPCNRIEASHHAMTQAAGSKVPQTAIAA